MTRDEAKALTPGTVLRYRDDTSASRFVRFVSADGYRFADVEHPAAYGLAGRRFRVRYERLEVWAGATVTGPARPVRRGRAGAR